MQRQQAHLATHTHTLHWVLTFRRAEHATTNYNDIANVCVCVCRVDNLCVCLRFLHWHLLAVITDAGCEQQQQLILHKWNRKQQLKRQKEHRTERWEWNWKLKTGLWPNVCIFAAMFFGFWLGLVVDTFVAGYHILHDCFLSCHLFFCCCSCCWH